MPPRALDSDGTHHTHHLVGPTPRSSTHGVNSRSEYRRTIQDGDGPVPECSIPDLPGANRVVSQVPRGPRAQHGSGQHRPGSTHRQPYIGPGTRHTSSPVRYDTSRATPMKGQHGADRDVTDRYRYHNKKERRKADHELKTQQILILHATGQAANYWPSCKIFSLPRLLLCARTPP